MDATQPQATMPADSGWVIEPRREGLKARAREVWRYRRLLRFFAAKALQKLYQRTFLGFGWVLIRPLFPLLVMTLVFGGILGVGSQGVPYFLFLVIGHSVWDLFAQATTWGTRSLEMNRGFLTKIYIPRLILPVAQMSPAFLNFAIHLAVAAVALVYYRSTTGVWYLSLLTLPWALVSLVMALTLALGISLWTSVPALTARDIRFTLTYVLSFWLYLTPVLYPLRVAPRYQWLVALNPMVGVVNMFKYGVFGIGVLDPREIATSVAIIGLVFGSGLWFFGRAEGDAADKV
jgi:lipopolysaccharide transport system permease protein